ncbi:hypothetical protein QFC22_005797 [Naganishia vaughanmartiniae]|uniref:Uncharacterized protein n=1 Tax=Naganishia vaughanmartiniae TaxID=1424756 RepID=A0ACC2WQC0_9TREE|nr:hypothetical protein QFC22_005797 [Naganishia vaughanmartiniae]
MSSQTRNLTSPSSDSLLLSPPSSSSLASSSNPTARYTTDHLLLTRGRSRAQPIHLVRQALGIPHFGIARGVVAPPNKGGRKFKEKQGPVPAVLGDSGTLVVDEPADGLRLAAVAVERQSVDDGKVKKALKPILSRLPLPSSTTTIIDHSARLSTPSALSIQLLEESDVYYTQARLPSLSEQDTHVWKVLHHFQPTGANYGAAFKAVADQVSNTIKETRLYHPGLDIPRLLREQEIATDMWPTTKCPGFTRQASAYVSLVQQAFNWSSLPPLPLHMAGKYYGVLFRSTRYPQHIPTAPPLFSHLDKPSAASALYAADREAHEEAVHSGGLLMYWYGEPDSQGNNVATCVWTGRDAAQKASRLEKHRLAAGLAGRVYKSYELVRYCVRKEEGEPGLRIEEWEEL